MESGGGGRHIALLRLISTVSDLPGTIEFALSCKLRVNNGVPVFIHALARDLLTPHASQKITAIQPCLSCSYRDILVFMVSAYVA